MPKANDAKTGWARKALLGLVAVLVAGAGLLVLVMNRQPEPSERPADSTATSGYAARQLRVNGQQFTLDVADTVDKQQLGLGRRASLPAGKGMLFVYPAEAERCFWMKDMNFAIDIIWLDGDKRIVHIEPEVSPDTYPKTYCPREAAQYVVELGSGAAGRAGMKPGQQLDF